jgi:hypothetical protein
VHAGTWMSVSETKLLEGRLQGRYSRVWVVCHHGHSFVDLVDQVLGYTREADVDV